MIKLLKLFLFKFSCLQAHKLGVLKSVLCQQVCAKIYDLLLT
jgi:hypothetical protein